MQAMRCLLTGVALQRTFRSMMALFSYCRPYVDFSQPIIHYAINLDYNIKLSHKALVSHKSGRLYIWSVKTPYSSERVPVGLAALRVVSCRSRP